MSKINKVIKITAKTNSSKLYKLKSKLIYV